MVVPSVHQRKSSQEKISNTDLWLPNQLVHQDHLTNLPYALPRFFTEATGIRTSSGLVGSQHITLLVRHHGILTPQVEASLTLLGEIGFINANQLKGMQVIEKGMSMNS